MTTTHILQTWVMGIGLLITPVWGVEPSKTPENYLAFSPVFGFDPVYGSIVGGAIFSYPANDALDQESVYRQLFFMGTFSGQFRLHGNEVTHQTQQAQQTHISFGIDNFFDYDFLNASDHYVAYDRWHFQSKLEYSNGFAPNWYWLKGGALEAETHQKDGDWLRVYPIIGLKFDDRDRSLNPSRGRLLVVPINYAVMLMNALLGIKNGYLNSNGVFQSIGG